MDQKIVNTVSIVTGGAGFIGSNLIRKLLDKKHTVICLDNLSTGSEYNIAEYRKNPDFVFIRHDITKELPVFQRIDYIFHLASPASVPDYQRLDEETAMVNSVGTRNMLRVAKAYSARLLFTSTSEIYGNPLEHPQKETNWGNVNPNGVRSCYDESKRFGEMITMLYHRKYSVDTRIVRIFNTYGPNMRPDDGRVVSNFINQAITEKPLSIYGNGSQTRSFCYIDDLVAGLMMVMMDDSSKGEVFNLGNPEEYSVHDLAEKILLLTGSKSPLVAYPLPKDDPERRRPDIGKIKLKLSWEPKVKLQEGLKKTIEYYKKIKLDKKLNIVVEK